MLACSSEDIDYTVERISFSKADFFQGQYKKCRMVISILIFLFIYKMLTPIDQYGNMLFWKSELSAENFRNNYLVFYKPKATL